MKWFSITELHSYVLSDVFIVIIFTLAVWFTNFNCFGLER